MKRISFLLTLMILFASALSFGYRPGLPMSGGDDKETAYLPFADVMPEPIGGLGAIAKKIVYPDQAKTAHIEGKIYLVAYINEKGDVDDVKIIRGLPAGCDDAAIKAIKETKFSPGKQNGAAIKVQLSIPITFKIQ